MTSFEIAGRPIGLEHPPYVIAELSANHAGSFEEAAELVRLAARAGADAVKLQTYTAETMTVQATTDSFKVGPGSPWEGRTLFDLYLEAHTPWDWHADLIQIARGAGVEIFSTAFDSTAVEFLEGLGVPAHKVASFEIVDHELVAVAASTGRPLILSTGMATVAEIGEAVDVARANGATQIALLKCTSAYPASPDEMNLRSIPVMRAAFGLEIGLSDHSLGLGVPIAAVTVGATLIEKHIANPSAGMTADSSFSLPAGEFAEMVELTRVAFRALGGERIGPTESERAGLAFRRSIFVTADVERGEPVSRENVRAIRPGHGLPPKFLPQVLGRLFAADIRMGTPLSWDHLK